VGALAIVFTLIFIFTGVSCSPSSSAEEKIDWVTYEAGLALAKTENKNIFLHFYADW